MDITALLNALPNGVAQGLIWGIMGIGVYITYKILDIADLSVDGTMVLGGAVCITMLLKGQPMWLALLVECLRDLQQDFFIPLWESRQYSRES